MAHGAERGLVDMARIHLFHTDPQRRRATSGLQCMDIMDARQVQVFGQVLLQPGFEQSALDHRRFRWRELADHAHHDGVLAMRDAGHPEDRAFAPARHIPGELAERALGFGLIHQYLALDHDFGMGRHFEINGLAFDHLDRLTADTAGDRQLVGAIACRCHQILHRVAADKDRRRHVFAARLVFRVMDRAAPVGRAEQDAGRVLAFDLTAADADIAPPGVRILGHPERRQIRARVFFRRPDRHRQFVQVDIIALDDDLFYRAGLDHHRLDRRVHTAGDTFVDGLERRRAVQRGGNHLARRRNYAADDPATFMSLDIAKANAVPVVFVHRAKNHAHDRADLPVLVDFLVDPFEHALLFQYLQPGAKALIRH